jgi:hypothetical protein
MEPTTRSSILNAIRTGGSNAQAIMRQYQISAPVYGALKREAGGGATGPVTPGRRGRARQSPATQTARTAKPSRARNANVTRLQQPAAAPVSANAQASSVAGAHIWEAKVIVASTKTVRVRADTSEQAMKLVRQQDPNVVEIVNLDLTGAERFFGSNWGQNQGGQNTGTGRTPRAGRGRANSAGTNAGTRRPRAARSPKSGGATS